MSVSIQDGLQYFKDCEEKFEVIMLDVDSKDITSGMSCPPKQFVLEESLQRINKCLQPNGLFILNLVCRDAFSLLVYPQGKHSTIIWTDSKIDTKKFRP